MRWYNPLTWVPFTREGRQTLIYVVLSGCGPVLTACVLWAMHVIRNWDDVSAEARLDKFATLAFILAASLLTIVVAFSCFVSIRAIKVGKDGIEATGHSGDGQ